MFFRTRSTELELMDEPFRVSRTEMVGCLAGLDRVNRFLGGYASLKKGVFRSSFRPRKGRPLAVCDVGCGGGESAIVLAREAKRRGIPIRITGIELNPDLAAAARRTCRSHPEITILHADAREVLRASAERPSSRVRPGGEANLPALSNPFDVVTASLFLHHFAAEEVVAWLALMMGAARLGVVINDLERSVVAWVGIKIAGPVLCRNSVFLHDAPLSVRRAYTIPEWEEMASKAAPDGDVSISREWACRALMVMLK